MDDTRVLSFWRANPKRFNNRILCRTCQLTNNRVTMHVPTCISASSRAVAQRRQISFQNFRFDSAAGQSEQIALALWRTPLCLCLPNEPKTSNPVPHWWGSDKWLLFLSLHCAHWRFCTRNSWLLARLRESKSVGKAGCQEFHAWFYETAQPGNILTIHPGLVTIFR